MKQNGTLIMSLITPAFLVVISYDDVAPPDEWNYNARSKWGLNSRRS